MADSQKDIDALTKEFTPTADFDRWFNAIVQTRGPQGKGYDYKGWYDWATPEQRHAVVVDPKLHFTDKFKTPDHITFSTDSMYSTPETPGGRWVIEGDGKWHYYPSEFVVKKQTPQRLKQYFKDKEKNSVLHMPGE